MFYVYILLNSNKLVDYCPHQMMDIVKYNNLRRYGNFFDIKVCAIDKNFNAVGVYGSNLKNTIIKNCRTWLHNAQYNGLL